MSKSDVVQLIHFYGRLQPFQDYEVAFEGGDYVKLVNGYCVPSHMIRKPWEKPKYESEYARYDEEEDEFYA